MGSSVTCCVTGEHEGSLSKMEMLGLSDLENEKINPWSRIEDAEGHETDEFPRPNFDCQGNCFRRPAWTVCCEQQECRLAEDSGAVSGLHRSTRPIEGTSEGVVDLRDHLVEPTSTGSFGSIDVASLGAHIQQARVKRRGDRAVAGSVAHDRNSSQSKVYGVAGTYNGHHTSQLEMLDDAHAPRNVLAEAPADEPDFVILKQAQA